MYLPLLFFRYMFYSGFKIVSNTICIMIYVIYVLSPSFCINVFVVIGISSGYSLSVKLRSWHLLVHFMLFFQNKYYILITRFKFFTYTCTVVFSSLLIRKKYITLSAYMTILSFFESDQNVLWLTNALIDCMNYFVQRSINRQIS